MEPPGSNPGFHVSPGFHLPGGSHLYPRIQPILWIPPTPGFHPPPGSSSLPGAPPVPGSSSPPGSHPSPGFCLSLGFHPLPPSPHPSVLRAWLKYLLGALLCSVMGLDSPSPGGFFRDLFELPSPPQIPPGAEHTWQLSCAGLESFLRIQGMICREKGAAHQGGPCQNWGLVGEPGIWGWGRTRCRPSQGSCTGSSASAIDFLLWSSGRKMRRWGCGAAAVICCLLGVSWRGWELILEPLESVSRAGEGEMWGAGEGTAAGGSAQPPGCGRWDLPDLLMVVPTLCWG